jgi:hypothetical protein
MKYGDSYTSLITSSYSRAYSFETKGVNGFHHYHQHEIFALKLFLFSRTYDSQAPETVEATDIDTWNKFTNRRPDTRQTTASSHPSLHRHA